MALEEQLNQKIEKKRSEVKLPRKPRRFLITVLSGKIKFGSSEEKLSNDISNKIPAIMTLRAKVSIILFIPKLIVLFTSFLNSIN